MRSLPRICGSLLLAAAVATCSDQTTAPEMDAGPELAPRYSSHPLPPWTLQQAGSFSGVQFVDPSHGWAISGGVWRTTDGGAVWTHVPASFPDRIRPGRIRDLSFADPDNGWAVGFQSIHRTGDGGQTWTRVFNQWFSPSTALDVDFVDAQHGFASGTQRRFYRTTDGGQTWQRRGVQMAPNPQFNEDLRIEFVDPSTGYAFSSFGRISKTTNGGLSWTIQSTGTRAWFRGGSCVDADTCWIAGSGGVVAHTSDGGGTWTLQQVPGNPILVAASFVDASTGWVSGTGGAVFQTTDGGASWRLHGTGSQAFYPGISFVDAAHGWLAGSDGIWAFVGGPDVIEIAIDIKPGSDPSSVGCRSVRGVVPVAALSDDDFDATTLDANSVRFGKAGDEAAETHRKRGEAKRHVEDVDGDGRDDMVFHFRLGETGFSCDDIPAGQRDATLDGTLTGQTVDGDDVEGVSDLRLVGGR